MTANIVVGVDGSDTSFEALQWAIHEARRRHAELRIVACAPLPPRDVDPDSAQDDAAAVLAEAAALIASIDGHLVSHGVTPMCSPVAGIIGAAERGDVIVVGATGHTGFLGGLLGSVAAGVTHRSRVPVVVVPAKAPCAAGDAMRKIVVGVDGSPEATHALAWAYDEAEASRAELDVVHSWLYPYPVSDESPREVRQPMQADAQRELQLSMDTLSARRERGSVDVRSHLYEDSAVDALLREGDDADLIVVGCRGRGGLRARLLGSVSRTIVQHAPCPVAVIRGADA
jgi:nucleotide-binding universal stress UspA family protein